jgi:SAM-dependent methyltransferase
MNLSERAYTYRSFEHYKRETFSIIANIVNGMNRPVRLIDVCCGPAVLEGIIAATIGSKLVEVLLLDIEENFLNLAKEHLRGRIEAINVHVTDLNEVNSLPDARGFDVIVSTNGIFHAAADSLPHLYKWAFSSLVPEGILINHQTFGGPAALLTDSLCPFLDSNVALDHLDKELMLRSRHDTMLGEGPVNARLAGKYYQGLHLDVSDHLEILTKVGFTAGEIWRKGKSAIIIGQKH